MDAFAVLRASSQAASRKRKSPEAARTLLSPVGSQRCRTPFLAAECSHGGGGLRSGACADARDGSHLTECPKCGTRVHRDLASQHVEECLRVPAQRPAQLTSPPPTPQPPPEPAASAANPPRRPDAFAVLRQNAPAAFPATPADEPTPQKQPPASSPAARVHSGAAASTSASAQSNAFAVMRENAAEVFETHVFFLGVVGVEWRCAMWLQGSPPPADVPRGYAWTATIKVMLPAVTADNTPLSGSDARRQVAVKLLSNVRPAGATACAALTLAGERLREAEKAAHARGDSISRTFTGNASLLKSALQVRSAN